MYKSSTGTPLAVTERVGGLVLVGTAVRSSSVLQGFSVWLSCESHELHQYGSYELQNAHDSGGAGNFVHKATSDRPLPSETLTEPLVRWR